MQPPAEVLQYIKQMVDFRQKMTPTYEPFKWCCYEEMVLKLGYGYENQGRPKKYKKGTPRHCFANSAELAMRNKNLIYVEGYGIVRGVGIHVHHAWVAERGSDKVIDVTTENVEHYHGIPFRTDYLRERWQISPTGVSLLDNWHEDYPLLQLSEEEIRPLMEDFLV